MSDLVARLRDKHCCDNGCHCDEAADEIERLRAALQHISNLSPTEPHKMQIKARAALTQEKPND